MILIAIFARALFLLFYSYIRAPNWQEKIWYYTKTAFIEWLIVWQGVTVRTFLQIMYEFMSHLFATGHKWWELSEIYTTKSDKLQLVTRDQ